MGQERKQPKVSEDLKKLISRVGHLEDISEELNIIEATLIVNFGENGRVANLWGREDLTTMSMLNKALEYLGKRK